MPSVSKNNGSAASVVVNMETKIHESEELLKTNVEEEAN